MAMQPPYRKPEPLNSGQMRSGPLKAEPGRQAAAPHPSPRGVGDVRGDTATRGALGRQSRLIAIVLAVAGAGWLGMQWLGAALGLPGNYAFLFDLMAMAAFVWAFVATWRVWQKTRVGE